MAPKPTPKPTPSAEARMKNKPSNFTDSEWANTVPVKAGKYRIVERNRSGGEYSKNEKASYDAYTTVLNDRYYKKQAKQAELSRKAKSFIRTPETPAAVSKYRGR